MKRGAAILAAAWLGAGAALADPPPATPPVPGGAVPPPGLGTIVPPPNISAPDSWVARQGAVLRVLNKLDSTVQTLSLKVGETAKLQSLSITLQACAVRPPDLPADATAHLQVTDSRPDQPGFDGWMLQNEPAITMLEHPVYDIQLAGCT